MSGTSPTSSTPSTPSALVQIKNMLEQIEYEPSHPSPLDSLDPADPSRFAPPNVPHHRRFTNPSPRPVLLLLPFSIRVVLFFLFLHPPFPPFSSLSLNTTRQV